MRKQPLIKIKQKSEIVGRGTVVGELNGSGMQQPRACGLSMTTVLVRLCHYCEDNIVADYYRVNKTRVFSGYISIVNTPTKHYVYAFVPDYSEFISEYLAQTISLRKFSPYLIEQKGASGR